MMNNRQRNRGNNKNQNENQQSTQVTVHFMSVVTFSFRVLGGSKKGEA
ncbi:MAG: hypothetical protein ACOX1U_10410 [Saccharofermentanales bacterium]